MGYKCRAQGGRGKLKKVKKTGYTGSEKGRVVKGHLK